MSLILNISTAVPNHKITKEDLVNFYSAAVKTSEPERFKQKLTFLSRKMKIDGRYSCIKDYAGLEQELFTEGNYKPSVEKRMQIYQEKIVPLASKAVNNLFSESKIDPTDITHVITVSCTGLMAPGLEFLIAEQFGLQHTEKCALNFLGCYAAVKALKQAHYIAQTQPDACILIVSAELCSLHFYPSDKDEDLISNLLFADGAAAVLMCGEKNRLARNKTTLRIDSVGSAFIPNTADLMKWELTSSAFKMHLSAKVVDAIKETICEVVDEFLGERQSQTDYWAIHPGGVKIVEAVRQSLNLTESQVKSSLEVLNNYGNMSSPTILFILKNIFDEISDANENKNKKLFACAFGPGLNVELLSLSSVYPGENTILNYLAKEYAIAN